MNKFQNLSLSIKLNLVIAVAIIALSVGLVVQQLNSTNILIDEIGQLRIEEEIRLIESRLIEAQQELVIRATVLVNTPGIAQAVEDGNENVLRSLTLTAAPSLNIDGLILVNLEGERLIDNNNFESNFDQLKSSIDQVLLGIQRTVIVGDSQSVSILSIRPIRNTSGLVVGGILVSRQLTDDFLTQFNFDRDGVRLALVYGEDVIAQAKASTDDNTTASFNQIDTTLVTSALGGDTIVNPDVVYSDKNRPFTQAYIPVQGLDERSPTATIVTQVDNGTIATFQSNLIGNSIITVALLALGIVISVVLLIRLTVTKRLQSLESVASAIAKGDYSQEIDLSGQDEIGQLAKQFDQMSNDIQRREAELEQLNQSLEQRVAERTVDLKKARDEALMAKRIADENSRLKSEFLSMMSHELRTPMNAIQGFTDIILARMAGTDYNNRTERYLQKIQANSARLLGLINDFLDLSRIESGRLELAHMPISVNELAQSWTDLLSILAENKGLELAVNVDPNLPKTIYGDDESLTKIVVNLLGNAIKFTDDGSVILNLDKQNDKMLIKVTDTGMGIPPHAREFIFDEFRQVDMSSKRKHGGTGLGLSIVQKLAVAMGGTVAVQSEVGVGSIFTVSIPLQLEPQLA